VSIRSKLAAVLGVAMVAVLPVLGASPAWAHDAVAPARVVAGSAVNVTLAVINEHDLPSDGIEVRLPPGFALTSHEQVPGWKSQVIKRTDGTPTAVRWTGGLLQSNESGEFVIAGKAPSTAGFLLWVVAQKSLGRGDYIAPPVSFSPQMTVTAEPLTGATDTAAPVPLAAQPQSGATQPVDGVARSRATLALVLAVVALIAVVFFEMTLVRRGQLAANRAENTAAEPANQPAETPAVAHTPGRVPRPAGAAAPRKDGKRKGNRSVGTPNR